jgi:putative Mn2+ efflux pump MntP
LGTLEIGIVAVALAMDAFSVAASVGPRCCPRWGAVRMAGSFGGFQAGMPLLGALGGSLFYVYVREFDHWVAFGLLEVVGLRMVYEAVRHWRGETGGAEGAGFDPSRGLPLVWLSVATSIDAFGAGMGLRMAGANLWVACPVIGVTAAVLTYVGASLGVRAEQWLGRKAELVGGLVLVGLGVKMLGI